MKNQIQKYGFLIIPVLFLIYSAPSALDYVFHFPDEKYYTDSVIQMLEKNDYFTPYKADGSPRFNKPIITYWVLIGSYKLFGVGIFSSRLFFWFAGALLVFITYLMSFSLFKKQHIAFISAFITAANPLVLLSASRSIPDILLTLFLTISAWGFLEIMISESVKNKHYWMAYLGAALAFETKGLPAAAFAGTSMLFLLFNPWKRVKINQLFKPVSLVVSIGVALSWFIIMYVKHGSVYLDSFFADQVGERVSSKIAQVFGNAGLGIVNLLAFLIPWIIIFFSNPKKLVLFFRVETSGNKAVYGFIAVWIILIILMAGSVFKFYDRYLLPVIPLVSILFSVVFSETETRFQKNIKNAFIGLSAIFIVLNFLYAIFIVSAKIIWMGIIFSGIVLVFLLANQYKYTRNEVKIANAFLLFFFNVFIIMHALLMPNPGEQLVKNLQKHIISEKTEIYVYGNIRAASNIRMHSKNQLHVISMDTIFTLPTSKNHVLVFNEKEMEYLNLKDYSIFNGSEEWSAVKTEKFPELLQPGIKRLKEDGTHYKIAKPKY